MRAMKIDRHVEALSVAAERMDELIPTAALDASVPPCPEWVVRDLIRHLGGIHRWAATFVREGRTEPIRLDLEDLVGGWPDDAELARWFNEGHRSLVEELAGAPEDLVCFTFLEAPSPLQMWARRQAHETSIHRIDLESAVGRVTGFPADVACDGIDELLTAFITRPGRGPRSDAPTSLAIQPTDADAAWTVSFDDESCRTVRSLEPADSVAVGTGADLYAWLWNRPSPGSVEVNGHPAPARAWQETMHVRWS